MLERNPARHGYNISHHYEELIPFNFTRPNAPIYMDVESLAAVREVIKTNEVIVPETQDGQWDQ